MNQSRQLRMSKLALGLVVALAAAPSFAQNTTAGVGGQVLGADGAPVAGAEITILHTESGTVSRAVTDASGRYNARGLRVGGPYTITVNKEGGGTKSQEEIYLGLDKVSQVDVALNNDVTTLATVKAIAAGGSELFSADRMGAGTNITRDQIEALPSIKRDLQDYARLDPRISQTDKERGEISAGGQNTRFNSITIDGVATSDTFGLEANNLPTIKQPISIDSIQEVNVNIANYDVTQKGYTGANINAVTKSGTNDFHGTATYVFRDESAVGRRYSRSTGTYSDFGPFSEKTWGVTLGGPLIKDRLFFFAQYEDFTSSKTLPDFGPLGSGAGTEVGLTQPLIDQFAALAQSRYGMDLGNSEIPSGFETRVKDALFKIDWNISDTQRASLRYSKTEQDEPFLTNFGTRSLSLSSNWYNQAKEIETWVGEWFSDWSENFSTELKVSHRGYDSAPINNARLPQITLGFPRRAADYPAGTNALTGTINLVSGTERSRHFNELATDTLDVYFGANWYAGDHTVKFGADYNKNEVFNAFLQDTLGQYTFGCVNSSATYLYTGNAAIPGGAVNCSTSTLAVIDAAILHNFNIGRPTNYQAQIGAPGFVIEDGAADWALNNIGFFIQDTWAVNNNLTLTYGVRIDMPSVDESPAFNAAASAPVGPIVAGRQTGGFGYNNSVTIDGKELVQPRFGFNYTFDGDRPTQLRGGVGLFQGAAANVWLSNPYSNTGIATRIIGCGGSFGNCPNVGGTFSPDPDTQPGLTGTPPTANVDFISDDLRQPSVWKANLAIEHELPFWGGTVVSAEYVMTQVNDGINYRFLNLGAATRLGPDGRQLFYTPQAYLPGCFTTTGGSITTGACAGFRSRAGSNALYNNVIIADSTSKGRGDNFTLALSRPMSNDWAWSLAYSYTEASDVSPLTSSTSNSNWNGRSTFDPNEDVASRSNYVIRDRFIGTFDWQRAFFGDYKTRFGVVYEGRKGKPYSWTYINDLNGDGIGGNDLMYIPTPGDNTVVFRDLNANGSADEEAQFWSVVNANPELRSRIGGVAARNEAFSPWVNSFDVRISQELPGFMAKHKSVITLDILNVGNLLNKEWGRVDEIGFPSNRSFVFYGGLDAQNRYTYIVGSTEDFVTRQERAESQWAAQLTLQYKF